MLFLSRVRAGVLVSSVALSTVILTLSAILIYNRISYPLEFPVGVYGTDPGGPEEEVQRDVVDLALLRYGTFVGTPRVPPDVMVTGNPHHLAAPVRCVRLSA